MECPACGSENSERATFCSLCLGPLSAPAPSVPDSVQPAPAQSPAAPIPPAPEWACGDATPLEPGPGVAAHERFTSATSELEGKLAGRKIDRSLAPKNGRLALPGGLSISPFGAMMLIPGVLMLAGIAIWIASGGLASMNAGKVARIPVPVGSELVAVQRDITEGALGKLSEEVQDRLATRIFTFPTSFESGVEYYLNAAGAECLAEEGWREPEIHAHSPVEFNAEWTRDKYIGYQKQERQFLYIRLIPVDDGSCTARIACLSAGIEKIKFPEE